MAQIAHHVHACGERLAVYVPKVHLVEIASAAPSANNPPVGHPSWQRAILNARATDAHEEARGDIAAARRYAEADGQRWIDSRSDPLVCPKCGKAFQLGKGGSLIP